MSSFGAICRNCSFNFCSVDEFLVSSETNCLDEDMMDTWRILLRVSARLVPRWGVDKKIMADMASTIRLYSGSYWPCMYALKS